MDQQIRKREVPLMSDFEIELKILILKAMYKDELEKSSVDHKAHFKLESK